LHPSILRLESVLLRVARAEAGRFFSPRAPSDGLRLALPFGERLRPCAGFRPRRAVVGCGIRQDRRHAEATQVKFDDSSWQAIDLPHDWAVELPFKNDPELPGHGGKPLGRNYPETSIGWYRKAFELPESDAAKRITVEFDGMFRNAMVILNGLYLGKNLSGYAPFHFDLTDFLNSAARTF